MDVVRQPNQGWIEVIVGTATEVEIDPATGELDLRWRDRIDDIPAKRERQFAVERTCCAEQIGGGSIDRVHLADTAELLAWGKDYVFENGRHFEVESGWDVEPADVDSHGRARHRKRRGHSCGDPTEFRHYSLLL